MVYGIKQWNGTSWEEFGAGSASGGGISNDSVESYYPSVTVNNAGYPIKGVNMKKKKDEYGLPADMKTGTLNDEYLELLEFIAMYGMMIRQFFKEGKELERKIAEYENKYKPGTPEGISNGLFMGYLHIDYRFGKTGETILERLLKSEYLKKLNMPGPLYLKHISESYCSFYQIKKKKEHSMTLEELLTGEKSELIRIHDIEDNEVLEGQIWYIRLVGEQDKKCHMMGPYTYNPEYKEIICKDMTNLKNKYIELFKDKVEPNSIHREFCRAIVPKMSDIIITSGAEKYSC